MVGYTPTSFTDLDFASKKIEVDRKRGKFNHPAWTNEKTGANKEGEDEGETHAVTAIHIHHTMSCYKVTIMCKKTTSQQRHYTIQVI